MQNDSETRRLEDSRLRLRLQPRRGRSKRRLLREERKKECLAFEVVLRCSTEYSTIVLEEPAHSRRFESRPKPFGLQQTADAILSQPQATAATALYAQEQSKLLYQD